MRTLTSYCLDSTLSTTVIVRRAEERYNMMDDAFHDLGGQQATEHTKTTTSHVTNSSKRMLKAGKQMINGTQQLESRNV